MACNVIKNIDGTVSQVFADNGNPSNLFNDLVDKIGSKEDAHKIWLKTQTKSFKKDFKDVLDNNGEPYIESVEDLIESVPKPAIDIYKAALEDPTFVEANKELDSRMADFLNNYGFSIDVVNNLTDRAGNPITGRAKIDTLLKTVQVVRGKANEMTLPEEASHLFVELLKAKDSPLYRSMYNSVDKYDMYNKVSEEYSSNPLYQNEDGSVNEDKIRDEAIGKLIAAEVIKAHSTAETKQNVSRFGRWFQKVLNAIKRFFGGENSPFLAAAENMLSESKNAYLDAVDNITDAEMLQAEPEQTEDPQEKLTQSLLDDHEALVIKEWIQEDDGKLPRGLEVIEEFSDGKKLKRYKFTKDGKEYIISNRVTDQSTRDFVKKLGKDRALEITKSARSKHLRENGVRIHNAAQDLMDFYGSKSNMINVVDPDGRGKKTLEQIRKESGLNKVHFEVFKTGVRNHIKQIEIQQEKIGKGKANLITELKIVDPHKVLAGLEGVAGTMDVAVVYSDGSMDLLDWKTVSPSSFFKDRKGNIVRNPFRTKMDSYNTQIGTYINMLKEVHGVEKFNRTRIVPIHVDYAKNVKGELTSSIVKFEMAHTNKEFLRSIAVALEKTDHKELDKLVNKLDNQIKRLKTQQRNVKAKRKDFAKLQARIEVLEDAMQELVVKGDIVSLIDNVAQRISTVTAGIGIKDTNDPDYLTNEDLRAIYEDFTMFQGITDGTVDYLDEMIAKSKDKEKARAYRDAFNDASTIVDNNLKRVRNEWLSRLTEIARQDGQDLSETPKSQSGIFGMLTRNFTSMDVYPHPAFRAAYKKIYESFNKTKVITDALNDEIQDITFGKEINGKRDGGLNKWAKDNGMTLKQAFKDILIQDTKDKKGKVIYRNLVPMFSKEFRDTIKSKQEKNDVIWMKQNFKIKEGAREKFNLMRKNAVERESYLFPEDNQIGIRKANMKAWDQKFNVFDPLYDKAWLNPYWSMFLEPKNPAEHYSEKYKVIAKNKPVLDYYNTYRRITSEMGDTANIKMSPNFIAHVKDDMVESLLNNGIGLKGMNEMVDAISRSFMVKAEQETMGVFSNDGSFVNQIPLPYVNELTNKKGEIDAGLKSIDLSKSLYLLATSVYNHKHMGEIESYVMGLKEMIIEKGEAVTKNGVLQYQGSEIRRQDASPETLANYDKFVNFYLYGQRIQNDDIIVGGVSAIKTVKSLQSLYSMKVLGLAFVPGIAARITGGINMFLNGIDGVHYTNKHLNVARKNFAMNNKQWHAFVNYVDPFQAGLTWRKAKDLSMKAANKVLDLDNWYFPLRSPDENIDGMITVAMAQNHGIDKEGVLQRLVDLPEGTPSLWDSFTKNHKEGSLLINGMTQQSYNDFRLRVKAVARKIKGEMSDENIYTFSTSLTGQVMLQFKSWLPGIVESRFGGTKYNDVLKVLEEGRFRGFIKSALGVDSIPHGKKLLKEELGLKIMLQNTLKRGLDSVTYLTFLKKYIADPAKKAKLEKEGKWTDAMDKRYKSRVKRLEGEFERFKRNSTDPRIKNISLKEFLRMRERSVTRTLAEVRALIGMYLAAMAMGMGVGPDDEKWKNKTWLNRKIYMLLARTRMELGFTVNPMEFVTLTRGLVPLTGLLTDSYKVVENGWQESLEMLGVIAENKRDKTPLFYHTLKFVPGWSQLRRIIEPYEQDKRNPYVTR